MIYFVIAVIVIFAVYAVYENVFCLKVRHEKLGSGVKVAHISDLHHRKFGRDNIKLVNKVRAEAPDLIIVSGDLITRYDTDYSPAEALLKGLHGIASVYVIYGNHEQSVPKERRAQLGAMFARNDQTVLKNSCAELLVGERVLKIYGLLEDYSVYKKNGGYRDLDVITEKDIEKLLGKCPGGEVLLIAHNPFFGEEYAKWGAKYTFSGHVHGGSVRLFGKAMLSPERRFFPKYSKGVFDFGGKKLLVSAGLGKLRLFDPPEIVIYEI
ncbi:MAG: metallophosphoesterase [Ruminococcus sp.]|uniref:metallophosphoesterase n=1 Tax=Ruminococcus sp. TaxID=41978 RepID=UPI0025FD7788|nr:metallophosphoesterase [Ruminococcus sp.]MBR5683851.1 metallophosphoesterase [Ruminococcus sp.]